MEIVRLPSVKGDYYVTTCCIYDYLVTICNFYNKKYRMDFSGEVVTAKQLTDFLKVKFKKIPSKYTYYGIELAEGLKVRFWYYQAIEMNYAIAVVGNNKS